MSGGRRPALNPYVTGPPVGGSPSFVGRQGILRRVMNVVRRPGEAAVVLYGQRRIGKTSILQELASWLPQQGPYTAVVFDLQDKAATPLGEVLQELAWRIGDAVGLDPVPDLGPHAEVSFEQDFLPRVMRALGEEGQLVLLFDEFDVLADPGQESAAQAFFPYLRALLDARPSRLDFVFVIGRNIADLETRALALFKIMPALEVSVLDRGELEQLVRLAERQGSLRFTEAAVEAIWGLTHGHPLLSQQLCSELWERAWRLRDAESPEDAPPPVVNADDLDDALVERVLDGARNTLEWLWDGLGPAQRVVASALAAAGRRPIRDLELETLLHDSGVRVVYRELQKAPQLLKEWDILVPSEEGYRFKVELLRRWIAEHKPLDRVQEELDYVLPAAENLYLAAESLFGAGDVEQALPLLRQAVRLNQNHVRATELLADVLLSQGEREEARRLLERLFAYQPRSARPRLVQLLLDDATEASSEDARLALYDHILELSPGQRNAAQERQGIWQRRARHAEEAGHLRQAMGAWREAGDEARAALVEGRWRERELGVRTEKVRELLAKEHLAEARRRLEELEEHLPEADVAELWLDLERRQELSTTYHKALGAMAEGDEQTARRLFAQVASIDPEYKEATQHLIDSVSHDPLDERPSRPVGPGNTGAGALSDTDQAILDQSTRMEPPEAPPAWWNRMGTGLVVGLAGALVVALGYTAMNPKGTGRTGGSDTGLVELGMPGEDLSSMDHDSLLLNCQTRGNHRACWALSGERVAWLEGQAGRQEDPTRSVEHLSLLGSYCSKLSLLACVRVEQASRRVWLDTAHQQLLATCAPGKVGSCDEPVRAWAAESMPPPGTDEQALTYAAACDRLGPWSCAQLADLYEDSDYAGTALVGADGADLIDFIAEGAALRACDLDDQQPRCKARPDQVGESVNPYQTEWGNGSLRFHPQPWR